MSGKLKEVRERIRSVITTQQTTKAMKMVSAAKLRRAQEAITQMRPYADGLERMLRNILSNLGEGAGTSFGITRDVEKVLLVIVTSNRGLAGAFNTNIIKSLATEIEDNYMDIYERGDLTIVPIGKKGRDFFKKRYPKATFIEDHVLLFDDLTYANVQNVAQGLMDAFSDGSYDMIKVAYAQFKNAALQENIVAQFLPVPKASMEVAPNAKKVVADYIFEPSKQELLEELVPSILQTQIFKYCLDTHASEHGARMTAMDKATENAEELLKELRINYNKARQESITGEILEIVGGAAALEG
jgi:F-type H+-transporting ATPase subunit gamma